MHTTRTAPNITEKVAEVSDDELFIALEKAKGLLWRKSTKETVKSKKRRTRLKISVRLSSLRDTS